MLLFSQDFCWSKTGLNFSTPSVPLNTWRSSEEELNNSEFRHVNLQIICCLCILNLFLSWKKRYFSPLNSVSVFTSLVNVVAASVLQLWTYRTWIISACVRWRRSVMAMWWSGTTPASVTSKAATGRSCSDQWTSAYELETMQQCTAVVRDWIQIF